MCGRQDHPLKWAIGHSNDLRHSCVLVGRMGCDIWRCVFNSATSWVLVLHWEERSVEGCISDNIMHRLRLWGNFGLLRLSKYVSH